MAQETDQPAQLAQRSRPRACRFCRAPLPPRRPGPGRPRLACEECVHTRRYAGYAADHRRAAKAYSRRHRAQGRCLHCPAPVVPGLSKCSRHLQGQRAPDPDLEHRRRAYVALTDRLYMEVESSQKARRGRAARAARAAKRALALDQAATELNAVLVERRRRARVERDQDSQDQGT